MPKFKITSADGVVFGGKNVPKDTVVELDRGPHTDAWIRFKQAVEVKDAPEESGKKK